MDQTALEKYYGSGKIPEDFDALWDTWITEVRQMPSEYEIIERPCLYKDVIYEWLVFRGTGGEKIYCHILRPQKPEKKPVLFQFHGYSASSGDMFEKLPYVYNDMVIIAMDARGQGGLSEDHTITKGSTWQGHIVRGISEGRENLLLRKVFLDIVKLIQITKKLPFCNSEKMACMGFSQGGGLSVVCAALNPEIQVAGIGYPFLSDYRKACELSKNGKYQAYEELGFYFKVRDPLHEREEEIFRILDYIDVSYLAKRINAKCLCFCGLQDELVPLETQYAVFNQIKAEKRMYIYPEYGHEVLPGTGEIVLRELLDVFKSMKA